VADAMERADVAPLALRLFPTLSGGEQARASFARTLAQAAPLLLLDEPTAALAIRHQEAVLAVARATAPLGAGVGGGLHGPPPAGGAGRGVGRPPRGPRPGGGPAGGGAHRRPADPGLRTPRARARRGRLARRRPRPDASGGGDMRALVTGLLAAAAL